MTDSGTMDIHIDPYDYTNDILVNLWLSCDVPFASRYFTKPGMHRLLEICLEAIMYDDISYVFMNKDSPWTLSMMCINKYVTCL